jgi:hypothetical protein
MDSLYIFSKKFGRSFYREAKGWLGLKEYQVGDNSS